MTIISMIIGLAAAALLLTAGYLFGIRRGSQARDRLMRQNERQSQELGRQSQELSHLRGRLSQRADEQETSLAAAVHQVLMPLVHRERLSLGLSELIADPGQHRDLTLLLDQIAEAGDFSTVLLSNDEGLLLAVNRSAQDIDRLLATCSLLVLVGDRIAGSDGAAPLSILVYDEGNSTTLCRFFRAQDQRLALTAVANGGQLTPTMLDPALAKLGTVLSESL
ncbi:MAG: hypothetical protein C3F11_10705 [Methylocystaceae bacterium]|nr:MAG: hypothetical protein C3F11_10705 [Methylocystaceae bacterium]